MSYQLLNSDDVQVFPFGKKRYHDPNARVLNEQNITVKAHLKIDTGMHRLGVNFNDLANIKDIFSFKNLKILA